MVMGSTKDPHGTDEDNDNALIMPTLPERNHKKRTLQLFLVLRWPSLLSPFAEVASLSLLVSIEKKALHINGRS
jgi:hypothetical protein